MQNLRKQIAVCVYLLSYCSAFAQELEARARAIPELMAAVGPAPKESIVHRFVCQTWLSGGGADTSEVVLTEVLSQTPGRRHQIEGLSVFGQALPSDHVTRINADVATRLEFWPNSKVFVDYNVFCIQPGWVLFETAIQITHPSAALGSLTRMNSTYSIVNGKVLSFEDD
ncbi:MAG: hypothetical protein ACFB2Z_13320 [Maricaulaceae bacterium]